MFTHDKDYQLGYMTCAILKKNGDQYDHVEGFANTQRDPWSKMQLEPGSYVAIVYTNWNSANTDFTLWSYGPNNVNFFLVDEPAAYNKSIEALAQGLLNKTLPKKNEWKKMATEGVFGEIRYKFIMEGTGYGMYVFNNGASGQFMPTLTLSGKNTELIYPFDKKGNVAELTLKGGESGIVLCRCTNLPNSVQFDCDVKYRG